MELISKIAEFTFFTLMRYFLITIPVFLIFYVLLKGFFKKGKIQSKNAAKKDFLREIGNSVLSSFILALTGALVIFTPLRNFTQFYTGHQYPAWWLYMSVLLAFIIHDTYFYWMHRAVHHPRIFKYIHLTHHKSTNPSPFASYSFHALEAFAEGMILPILLFTIPMNPLSIFTFILGGFFINVYGHLGFEIMPKWFRKSLLFEVFNTSTYHNLHHSKFKGNYGLYLRFWDRAMGTENPDYVRTYDRIQQSRFEKK